jgi:peptide/nickel transport system ATP-binding protein
MTLLAVRDLCVDVPGGRAVDSVSFTLEAGEVLALIGESGAGKSLTGAAVIGLLPPAARVGGGEILLHDERIDDLDEDDWQDLRGKRISAVFQDPLTALDPLRRIGQQLSETLQAHHPVADKVRRERIGDWFDAVGLPRERARAFPHELSGGMRQRVALALALCPNPELLVADEPTTALDAVLKVQMAALLRRLAGRQGTAVLLISHDLHTVAAAADRVAVMYAGRIVETGAVADILAAPSHPYTVALLAALPGIEPPRARLQAIPGQMPLPGSRPGGCAFHPRCPNVAARCRTETPSLTETAPACFYPRPPARRSSTNGPAVAHG